MLGQFQMLWTPLRPLPVGHFADLIPSNGALFAVTEAQGNEGGIYKYSATQDDWTRLIEYTEHFNPLNHSTALGESDEIIYVFSEDKLYEYNVETNQVALLAAITNVGFWPKLFYANRCVHIIGGMRTHYAYNKALNLFADTQQLPSIDDHCHLLGNGVNLRSRDMVMLFNTQQSLCINFHTTSCYWQITRMNWPFDIGIRDAAIVSCAGDQFIIAFGGCTNFYEVQDSILVFNVSTSTFSESRVKCPEPGIFHATIIQNSHRDQIFAFYFNEYFVSSSYMTQLIGSFIGTEWIHLINYGNGRDWAIRVDEVLGTFTT